MHDFHDCKKKVSVIIPTFNEEKLIKRSVSQFNTEVKNKFDIEIIISDGGSQDSTIQIVKGYADRIILHKEKFSQNISQGRNEGAKNSLGDVLIFLNADTCIKDIDYLLNEISKELLEKDVVAIACSVYVFPEEEKFFDKAFHYFYNNFSDILNKFFIGMGRGECHIVKRETFFDVGGYNEDLAAGEDFELYKRLRNHGRIKFRKDLVVYESPRRYRKFGYSKVIWDWAKNSLSVILFNKSISKKWEAVR
jgi:glycosyltransferase involved in cell wall biosynthesis